MVLFAIAVAAATAAAAPNLKRTASAGGIAVTVTPLNLSNFADATIEFELVMDTHAGDLAFDLTTIATLKGERQGEVAPTGWSGGRGGHHLSGKLTFPAGTLRKEDRIILTLKGVGGARELVFEWEIPSGSYRNISASQLEQMLKKKDFFLVNTHVPYEGEIKPTDAFIPYDQTKARIKEYPSAKDARIVLYCKSGRMSEIAARILVQEGYTRVYNLEGGMIGWEKAGF
jgi:rhodanese-related sulfurtransferase